MMLVRNILMGTIFMLSFDSKAQQTNATFPAVIRIADRTSNSTARIADVLEKSSGMVGEIRDEIRLIRQQGQRSGDVFQERTSLAYWAAVVAVGSTIVFAEVGIYNLLSYYFNKHYPTATTVIEHRPADVNLQMLQTRNVEAVTLQMPTSS